MSFELLSDITDLKMKVSGKTLQDLFRAALKSVVFYLKPEVLQLKKGEGKLNQKIKIQTADINSLLAEFLSAVIAQTDIHSAVFTQVSFKKFGENFLEGEITGVKVSDFAKDIKAVSYTEVDIKRSPTSGRYETILVFDI